MRHRQNCVRQLPLFLISVVLFALWSEIDAVSDIIVRTQLGQILGTADLETEDGVRYSQFLSIPYAQPPVDSLRFQGILNATAEGPSCPQINIGTNQLIGDEDCLHLNIYSANLDDLKPVIVFIHGGGFTTGTSSPRLYGPQFFLNHKVVLITIQYRLGALGFLSTEDKSAPGNWGLLDQLEALNWIKSNVPSFGGDPNRITVMGEGAGAASASFLTLTTRAKGLFHNIIAISGTSLNSQYFQSNPTENARELAAQVGCNTYKNYAEMVACLRTVPADQLVRQVNNMFSFFSFPRAFAPCVDHVLLDAGPDEILQSGKFIKVPVLTGLSAHEGAFYYPLTLNSFNDGKFDGNFLDQRVPRLLPVISEFQSKLFPLAKALRKRYFSNIDADNEDEFRPRYIELLTDLLFTRFTSRYAHLLSAINVPVYYFNFEYQGAHSIMQVLGDSQIQNVAHNDILQYLFPNILGEERALDKDDANFAKAKLLTLFVNFVKFNNPTPSPLQGVTWPKFTPDNFTVLGVGRQLVVRDKFRTGIYKYWTENVPKLMSPNQKKEL